jgi:hypothetical protein
MHSSLGKDGHLVLVESVAYMTSTILSNDRGEEASFNDEVKFGGARVNVRSIEATGTEEADSDGTSLSHESREGSVVGTNNLFTFTLCNTCGAGGIGEVEDKVGVLKESRTFDCVGSKNELLEESQAACAWSCDWSCNGGWCASRSGKGGAGSASGGVRAIEAGDSGSWCRRDSVGQEHGSGRNKCRGIHYACIRRKSRQIGGELLNDCVW